MTRLLPPLLAAAVGFAAPLLIDNLAPHAFEAPWIALQWANLVVAATLIAGLIIIVTRRRQTAPAIARASLLWPLLAGSAFGTAIALKHAGGVSSDVMLFGLLPVSDAREYLSGAIRFLDSGHLSEWATRRPFAALHLAGLLAATGDGLRLTLALLAAGCAAGTLLLAGLFHRRFGPVAALGAFAALFPFIHLTLNTSMSESLGFALGCAAVVLLIEAAESGRRGWLWLGLTLLGAGLVARAGALFILPTLVLWCGWRWRADGARFSWTTAAGAVGAIAVAFLANKLLIASFGAPGQVAFGNFSFTLYGLAIGGEPWTRFFTDFPQAAGLPEGEQAAAAYHAALAHMQAAPFDLIKGVAARYNDFLVNTGWHKYVPNMALRALVLLLALTGVVHCWRRRREPLPALLLTGLAGMLLSVPFLGDGGPRVFAATHGFSAAFVALGLLVVEYRLAGAPGRPASAPLRPAAAVFAALVLLPLAIAASHAPRHQLNATRTCPAGETGFAGMLIGARAFGPAGMSDCPGLRAESLQATNIWKRPLVGEIAATANPTTIGLALAPTGTVWLRAPHGLPPAPTKIETCLPPGKGGDHNLSDYRP